MSQEVSVRRLPTSDPRDRNVAAELVTREAPPDREEIARQIASELTSADGEFSVVVAETGSHPAGILVADPIAGAEHATRIRYWRVGDHDAGRVALRQLIVAAVDDARTSASRFVMVDLPEDPASTGDLELFREMGFVREGRVPDLLRPGVAIGYWRRWLQDR